VVTTAIDDWNTQRLSSIQTIARLHAVWWLLASEPNSLIVEDEQTARESLSALPAPGLDATGRVLGAVRLQSSVAAIEHVVQLAEDRTGAGAMGTSSMRMDWCSKPLGDGAGATRS
jgi:hypothetical protein